MKVERGAYTIDELCERYRICKQTVYNERNRGRLKITKLGRKSLVLVEDVRTWLEGAPVHTSAHISRVAVGGPE